MTASVTGSPKYASAVFFRSCRIIEEICSGVYSLPRTFTLTISSAPPVISYGTIFSSWATSLWRRPMNRLIEKIVFLGLVICWWRAVWPTRISPLSVKATTEGVRRLPCELMRTFGWSPSITATTLLVVPRSIPTIFAMIAPSKSPLPAAGEHRQYAKVMPPTDATNPLYLLILHNPVAVAGHAISTGREAGWQEGDFCELWSLCNV